MNNYELTVILRNRETETLKEKIKAILAKNNTNITKEDDLGIKKLAYEIDNEKQGYYMYINFEAAPDSIKKITAEFKLNPDILRNMFIQIKTKKSA